MFLVFVNLHKVKKKAGEKSSWQAYDKNRF